MTVLDWALFLSTVAATAATTAFLAYYTSALRWEQEKPGRFIVAAVASLNALCWAGTMRRVDSWDHGRTYAQHINMVSVVAYTLLAIVFGAAVVAIWRGERARKREQERRKRGSE